MVLTAECIAQGLEDAVGVSVVHPTWQKTKPDDPNDEHYGWTFASPDDPPFKSPNGNGHGYSRESSHSQYST